MVLLIPKKHFEVCEVCSTFCRQHADRWDPIREILAINGYSLRNDHDFGPCPLWFSIFVASKLGCTTGWFDTAGPWWSIFLNLSIFVDSSACTKTRRLPGLCKGNLPAPRIWRMGMDNENQEFRTGQSGRYWFDFVFGVIPCDPMDMSWIYSLHFFADSSIIFKPRLNCVHLIRHGCSLMNNGHVGIPYPPKGTVMSTLDPCTASALGFAIGHARQAPFEFEPGSTWSYNSFHLQIAGAMAADAAKITTQEMPGVVLRRRGWLVMAGGCPPKFLGMNIMCIILYVYLFYIDVWMLRWNHQPAYASFFVGLKQL